MPRIEEVEPESAAPAIAEMLRAQEASFGYMLNATRIMGHCPDITAASGAMGQAVDNEGHIEPSLRYLLNVHVAGLNGCPF